MSVKTNTNTDPSTENANWGTLVILVVLAAVAVFIGVGLYNDHQKPTAPITLSAPASAASPTPDAMQGTPGTAAPAPTGSPAAGTGGGQ